MSACKDVTLPLMCWSVSKQSHLELANKISFPAILTVILTVILLLETEDIKTKNHIASCSWMVIYRLSFTDYVIKYSEEREIVFLHYNCEGMRERKSERAGEKQRKKV